MARIRAAVAAIAVLMALASGGLVAGGLGAAPAAAAVPHRAMVVVETGGATYHRVVTFSEDSITGLRALELAGAQPVVYSFAGQGGAVCRLFGVGRDASANCLGGADGDNRYWAYFRAGAGTTTFVYSRAGAGATQVHDGDVEGWKFGTGSAPAYAALPPVTPVTTAPPVGAPPANGGAVGAGGAAASAGGAPGAGVAPTNLDPEALARYLAAASTTTTTRPPATGHAAATRRAATKVEGKRSDGSVHASVMTGPGTGGGGGEAGSLVIFGVVAVALVGGGLLLRRSRRRPPVDQTSG